MIIYSRNLATFSHLQNFILLWRLKRGLISLKLCDTIVTVTNLGCLLCFVNIVNAVTKKHGFQLHQEYNEKFYSCVFLVILSFYKLFTTLVSNTYFKGVHYQFLSSLSTVFKLVGKSIVKTKLLGKKVSTCRNFSRILTNYLFT